MKIRFFILFVLVFLTVRSQEYRPIKVAGNNWTSQFTTYWDDYVYEMQFKFSDETFEFNGKTYTRMLIRDRGYEFPQNPPYGQWQPAGFSLADQAAQKKVWVYYDEEEPFFDHEPGEFLLFDFNLDVGDHIPFEGFASTVFVFDMEITDITYEYDVLPGVSWPVKTYWLDASETFQVPFLIYEGIGTTHGLLICHMAWDMVWELVGFRDQLSTVENKTDDILVYPNPFEDFIRIDTQKPVQKLELYDIRGRQLAGGIRTSTLETGELPPGLYILKVEFEKNDIKIYKLIKK